MSENYNSNFPKINQIVIEALAYGQQVVLIDMPEVLLRLKIAQNHSLEELRIILNQILNKIVSNKQGPQTADAAAYFYFPEVFSRPRDEYVAAFLHEIAQDETSIEVSAEEKKGYENILAYVGNLHAKPVNRMIASAQAKLVGPGNKKSVKSHLKSVKARKSAPFKLDYMSMCALTTKE